METVGKKFELEAFVSDYPVWVLGGPDYDDHDIAKHLRAQEREGVLGAFR
ncbi:hypothetical protein [Photorhabdus laumondii]